MKIDADAAGLDASRLGRIEDHLRTRYLEPGKIAGWIAPPAKGINGQPVEYEYVHFP